MMRNPFSDSRNRAAAQMAVQNVVLPVLLFTLIVDAALSCYDLGIILKLGTGAPPFLQT